MASALFKKLLDDVPESTKIEVRLSMDIAKRIHNLMRERQITQAELARLMEKDPAEINRWLSGMHTFTTKTLAKLQDVFGEPIVSVPVIDMSESVVVQCFT
jgi:transcriptional regulator with XRE-family HTH domain